MLRVFKQGALKEITSKLGDIVNQLGEVDYEQLHEDFCSWFQRTIKTNRGKETSYGQAAKTIDVAMKVIVGYCYLPRLEIAVRLAPRLHATIDTLILNDLKKDHRDNSEIRAINTLADITQDKYKKLQELLNKEAKKKGQIPIDYDDCLWRRLKELR